MKAFIRYLITQIKTIVKIEYIYTKRYSDSIIKSYIVNEDILSKGMNIRSNVRIYNKLKKIGFHTYIGDYTFIDNCEYIGNYCSISSGVKIGMTNHALDYIGTNPIFYNHKRSMVDNNTFQTPEPCLIGNDVLISTNAIIMSGVKIGNGAVIAAGAFVNKDVPDYAIVAGVPAKIIKYRFSKDKITALLNSQWWEKDLKYLQEYKEYFNSVDKFTKNFIS